MNIFWEFDAGRNDNAIVLGYYKEPSNPEKLTLHTDNFDQVEFTGLEGLEQFLNDLDRAVNHLREMKAVQPQPEE